MNNQFTNVSLVFFFLFPGKMWGAAFLLLAATLSASLARPRLHPLSDEMVNYINKVNTTWKVSLFLTLRRPSVDILSLLV